MNEIISSLIKYLLRERKIYNQADFSKKVGIASNVITDIKSGRKEISVEYAQRISKIFPQINKEWLLTGEGEMVNNKPINSEKRKKIYTILTFYQCLPLEEHSLVSILPELKI